MSARAAIFLFALAAASCGPTFEPASKISSVRILATAASEPYAAPGDVVTMSVLAFDGRTAKPAPMNVYWLPGACIDPPGDAYYACFPLLARAFHPGLDLGPELVSGATFSFSMPPTVIDAHPSTGGDRYGLAVVFTVACAGHVEYVPAPAGGSPDAVPLGCFDDHGARLGADDFVFAYSLVYAFADRRNANPVIENVTFGGIAVDPAAGIVVDHCAQASADDCPTTPIDVTVPASSQEADPGNLDAAGHALSEEIYVDYYLTGGKVTNDAAVLFDPRAGRLAGTGDGFSAPQAAGEYDLWAVVHDDRGGAAWQPVALHVR